MRYIKYLCLLMIAFTQWAYAIVHLSIEPSDPGLDDTIRLVFTYKGQADNIVPDFSLLDHDFRILSTGKRSDVAIINGEINATTQWIVTLEPKRAGKFLIPSLAFGKDKNLTRTINVIQKRHTPPTAGADIFMQATLDKKETYVQAQLTYTIKLFYSKQLASGNFSAPKVNNALILQLGKSKQYQTVIKGKTYQVAEQNYAVFPEKSGTLSISAPLFQGIMQRTDFANINQLLMNVHKPVRVTALDAKAKILPIPKSYPSGTWLPATKLTLTEQSQGFEDPKVGQPITRIIKMRVEGLTAEQLPALTFKSIEGANVYPQKPITQNHINKDTVIGEKSIRVVYIPSNGKNLTIPKLSIAWWDLKNNKLAYATLKSKTYAVTGVTPKPKATPIANIKPKTTPFNLNSLPTRENISKDMNLLLPWLITALLAGAWALFFIRRVIRKKVSSTVKKPKSAPAAAPKPINITKPLKKACVENDAQTAKTLFITWARQTWPEKNFHALSDVKALISDITLLSAIDRLEKSLYSQSTPWHGHGFWVAWLKMTSHSKKTKKKSTKDFSLPELNPSNK